MKENEERELNFQTKNLQSFQILPPQKSKTIAGTKFKLENSMM